jgi:hypothetical protein
MFMTPGTRARQQSFSSVLLRRLSRQTIAAPSDGVELFARRRAGRSMAAQITPVGRLFEFQPFFCHKQGYLQRRKRQ